MRKKKASKMDTALHVLLSDFDYRFDAGKLIRLGVPGFSCDEAVRISFCDILDAATWLCSIVHSSEYTDRFIAITEPKDS